MQHKITQKEQKGATKEGGISLTIMGQKSIYNSIHKPQWQPNDTIGFNQDGHPYRMCNETGIPEFLELQITGIPMVVRVPYLYISVTQVSSSEEPSRVHYAR